MPDKRYTKVEEEVIQILDRLESEKPATSRPNLRLVEPQRRRLPRRSFSISKVTTGRPWFWIAAAIGLAFVAILVRDAIPNLALALAIASICAFFAPIFVSRRPTGMGGPTGEIKQWRGRDISLEPQDGPSPAERLSRWISDRRRGGPRP
jgi:hypothetical protein